VNKRATTAVLGLLLMIFAAFMAIPLCIAINEREDPGEILGLEIGVGAGIAVGAVLFLLFRRRLQQDPLGTREGLAITTIGWIVLTAFGALPFLFSEKAPLSFTDAYFEVMSGLTTTGASILPRVEPMPAGLLFWRSLTHWIGGMGIILLSVAILPLLGAGGYQLFRAEVPGVTKDRMKPRILDTAKTLWMVYLGLSAAATVLLMICGLSFYEALCHTFSAVATGGFSTHTDSVGYFSSVRSGLSPGQARLAEMVIVLFMFIAGCNFVLLYRAARERSLKPFWRSSEFRCYLFVTLGAIFLIAVWLATAAAASDPNAPDYLTRTYGDAPPSALRRATFQTVSVLTTTGYGTDDFNAWPASARIVLLILMMVGGCAGGTAGGIKQMRIMLLARFAWREMAKVIRPRAVIQVKHDGLPVDREVLASLIGFFILYVGILIAGTLLLTTILQSDPRAMQMPGAEGPNGLLATAFTSVLASLSNIGPGLAGVGSTHHYGEIPVLGKWILSLCMLMGRLEIFTVVAILSPYTWRK
jgi:trk system potassium uptake protein TrkH